MMESYEVKLASRLKRRIEAIAFSNLQLKLDNENRMFSTDGEIEDEIINAIEYLSVPVCNDEDFLEMIKNIKKLLKEM